jgi:uncharacterized protein (TIGR03083 family)
MTEEVITKAKLIQKIEVSRMWLEEVLGQVDPSQMTQPGVVGDWSVKDIVAHLTAWERMMVAWLADYPKGVPVERPTSDAEFDEWNERIYLENKVKPLEEVLREFESTHEMTLQALHDTPEEVLFETGRYSYRGGLPLWQMVAGNTWWHYSEHGEEIQAALHRST